MELTRNEISFKLLAVIIREILRGKSLARTLLNYNLSAWEVSGEILDLGSKSDSASYGRFLVYKDHQITFTDLHHDGSGIVKLDLERPFSLPDDKFDAVTCFNVLEHVYDYRNALAESYRVLKPGGRFIGGTPFLVNYHPDPNDYFRYTHESLERIFVEAGFRRERIFYLGFGPLSAAFGISFIVVPKILRPFFLLPAIFLDLLILKLKPGLQWRYPLGFMYVFKKI